MHGEINNLVGVSVFPLRGASWTVLPYMISWFQRVRFSWTKAFFIDPSVRVKPRGGFAFLSSFLPNHTASRLRYDVYVYFHHQRTRRHRGLAWGGRLQFSYAMCSVDVSPLQFDVRHLRQSMASCTVFSSFAYGMPVKLRQFLLEYCSSSESR